MLSRVVFLVIVLATIVNTTKSDAVVFQEQQQQHIRRHLAKESYDSQQPNTPKININPAKQGNYTFRRLSYRFPSIKLPFVLEPVEVVGEVTVPRKLALNCTSPLVLFLHGDHATCYSGLPREQNTTVRWPCEAGYQPVPSHLGYRYISDILASQGYVAVSISTNGINAPENISQLDKVGARSTMIRQHLKMFAKWNSMGGDPWNSTLRGKINMNKVILVGHGGGGEGVHRAAIDSIPSDPYKIVGLVSFNPTAEGAHVKPDVHSVTILSSCTEDHRLDGQFYVDWSRNIARSEALRTAVTVTGANSNYFNTEWTPKLSKAFSQDDWEGSRNDFVCGTNNGTLRLSPQEQQVVGATYTVAFIRFVVRHDIEMLPLLDGSFVRPAAIGRAEAATSAVGGSGYQLLYTPGDGDVINQNGMIGFECSQDRILPFCVDGFSSPHFPDNGVGVAPDQLGYILSWTSKIGSIARFNVRANLTGNDWIDFRIANDPNKPPVLFDIVVSDRRGRNATLFLPDITQIDGWPGENFLDRMQARTFRGRLSSLKSSSMVDLSSIAAVSLVTKTASGRVWVLDIASSRRKIVKPKDLNLPVVSVDKVLVKEGDGKRNAVVNLRVTPTPRQPGVVWILDFRTFERYPIDIAVGSPSVVRQFPVSWTGDALYNQYPLSDASSSFRITATKGVVTGTDWGGVEVVDDDPVPILSVIGSTNITISEGNFFRWSFRISAPSDGIKYTFKIVTPSSGNELSTDDVTEDWFDTVSSYSYPTQPKLLSNYYIYIDTGFDYNKTTTTMDIVIPTVRDGNSEPNESIVLQLQRYPNVPTEQPDVVLVGTIRAH